MGKDVNMVNKVALIGPTRSGKKSVFLRLQHIGQGMEGQPGFSEAYEPLRGVARHWFQATSEAFQMAEARSSLHKDPITILHALPAQDTVGRSLVGMHKVFYCVDLAGPSIDKEALKAQVKQVQATIISSQTMIQLLGTKSENKQPGRWEVLTAVSRELELPWPRKVSAFHGEGMLKLYEEEINPAPLSPPCLHRTVAPLEADSTNHFLSSPDNMSVEFTWNQAALSQFYLAIQDVPLLRRRRLEAAADNLAAFIALSSKTEKEKCQKVDEFITDCNTILGTEYSFARKAVMSFAMAALISMLAVAVGVGIGMAAGAWIGPLAFIAAVKVANTIALSGFAGSALIGAGAGYATCRLFRPVSDEKIARVESSLKGLSVAG